ncbi:hypothetical protein JFL43_11660 [Viridibacillus sp. YIM B01967]|uniref:Transposase n=1 Tax=Viridibacillus soli TaxID=2798301 RepID=A0ABS1H7V2_9BACL|nr:hypothetical protein [Viridibacillus soli]MBK3495495.1 hypothetical protein [Viridibacillus soli]
MRLPALGKADEKNAKRLVKEKKGILRTIMNILFKKQSYYPLSTRK